MSTRIRRTLTALSLLLLLATLTLWLRSQWSATGVVYDSVTGATPPTARSSLGMMAFRGSFALAVDHQTFGPELPVTGVTGGPTALGLRYVTDKPQSLQRLGNGPVALGFAWQSWHRPMTVNGTPYGAEVNGRWYQADSRGTLIACPWVVLVLLFAIAPARALWRWRNARRLPAHACSHCGYDLRATASPTGPLFPTCPECGQQVARASCP